MVEQEKADRPAAYRIQVEGRIDASWSDWFQGMEHVYQNGTTTFTGFVADQAALRGILFKMWDLNLTVIAVNRIGEPTNPVTQNGKG
jgi:hypothetical protein